MKPGNLRRRKVPNPAKQSKDEDGEDLCSVDCDRAFLFPPTERMNTNGKAAFYF